MVYDELTTLMGTSCDTLNLSAKPPAVVLVAGLQGSGKTTSIAKLARWLKETQQKSVMVVSTDVYRPAAIEQLKTLADEVEATWFPSHAGERPLDIAKKALAAAEQQLIDVLLVDTAGRLHIDEAMMAEIKQLHSTLDPVETLLVIDSMAGQDAAATAEVFHATLPLTGLILTKVDGDARGGAALSLRSITGKPIKFIGVGEKTTALQPFHPDRMASRILGMGDILTLVEEAKTKFDEKQTKDLEKKLKSGKFDLDDFRNQIQQMGKMGGITGLLDKLPGAGMLPSGAKSKLNDKTFVQIEAIINSMTAKERRFPDIIRGSRKRRIALGSGTTLQDVNRLLKQFTQMQKMMKRFNKGGGMMKMMQQMQNGSGMSGLPGRFG